MALFYAQQFATTKLSVSGGIDASQTTGIVVQSVTGIDTTKAGVVCLDWSDPIDTAKYEYISYTSINGSNELQGVTRGVEGSTGRAHDNLVDVAWVLTESHINKLNDMFETAGEGYKQIATPANPDSGRNKLYFKSDNILYSLTSAGVEAQVGGSGGTAYWTAVAGTPTRVSDTQFTVTDTSNTNKYDLLFKKGVILKWLESTTVNVGMVISSSYGTNTVTVNIVGDSLTAGFSDMKYCMQMAETLDFIIPGTLATGTDLARTHYATTDLIKLSVDAFVKTAGTTNSTDFDINDDNTTIITTKPSIASAGTSDVNNVCDTPTTVIAEGSAITADIDAVSTTAPIEAYLKLFVFPSSWLYRS